MTVPRREPKPKPSRRTSSDASRAKRRGSSPDTSAAGERDTSHVDERDASRPTSGDASLLQRDDTLIPGTQVRLVDPRMVALLEPVGSVTPDPANPRKTKNLPALAAMFQAYGFSDPIVVNATTRIIEAGHQRYAALLSLGATHAPMLFAEHGKVDARGFSIAHNRSNEIVAEWDDEALRGLLRALNDEDAGAVAPLGYPEDELERLLGEYTATTTTFPTLLPSTTSDLKLRTFTLSKQQLELVERAIEEAKTRGLSHNPDANNGNTNANALAAICMLFLGHADG